MKLERLRSPEATRFVVISLLFLVLTLLLFRGVFAGDYLTGTDSTSTIYGPAMQKAHGSYYSSWDYYDSVGSLSYPSVALSVMNQVLLGSFDLTATDFAKIQLLVSFWLTGVISYYVLRALFKSDKAALLGSFVYLANGVFLSQIIEGHFGFITAYPFLILIFYLFYDAYWNGISRKSLVLPVLLMVYGSASAPHMVLLAALMMVFYAVFELLTSINKGRSQRRIFKVLWTAALVFLLTMPLAYIMLVLGDSSVLQTSYTLEQAHAGSASFLTVISVGESEITNTYAYFGEPHGMLLLGITQILAIPLFFFALLSLLVKRYRRLTVPALFIIVFGMFMAMGPDQPLGSLFNFMFNNVPMIDSFRAPSRFLLLNAMFYSILITITVANWKEITEVTSRSMRIKLELSVEGFWSFLNKLSVNRFPRPALRFPTLLVVVLLISSLCGLALIADGHIIQGFDAPEEYAAPYEYVLAYDEGGQYYKIYTLPMLTDCYQHPYKKSISGYGYPKGTTLDPGTYLTTTINENAMAHSTSVANFWSDLYGMIANRNYGYNDTLTLLGASGAVKYVIGQFFAPEGELENFTAMSGGTLLVNYSSGAMVLGVDAYSSPIKAQGGLIVSSGGLDAMFMLLGAGVFDPSNNTYASLVTANSGNIQELLAASELIVVSDGDLIELARELGLLNGLLLDLKGNVDIHRDDQGSTWVLVNDPALLSSSVRTTGNNTLTVRPGTAIEAGTRLMVRAEFGPYEGILNVSVNDKQVGSINLSAPISGQRWVAVDIPSSISQANSVSFTGADNRSATQVYDAFLMSNSTMESIHGQLTDLLTPYADKIGYIYTPLYTYLNNKNTTGLWYGPQANGMRSLDGENYTLPLTTLFDSELRLSVYSPDWGSREVQMDNVTLNASWSSGAYIYDYQALGSGGHELVMFPNGTYGMTLLPSYQSAMTGPDISYERVSSTEYRISVKNASGPFVIKFSEGPSIYWTMNMENGTATWFRSDYLANGFIVNGTGDLEITMEFSKQGEYEYYIQLYAGIMVASTALIVLYYFYEKRRRGGSLAGNVSGPGSTAEKDTSSEKR